MKVDNSKVLILFKAFGFSPRKSSFSYFYTIFMLTFSIINLLNSLIIIKFDNYGLTSLTKLLTKVSFYFSVITHTSLMLISIKSCNAESEIISKLDTIDEYTFKIFSVPKVKNDSWKSIFLFVGYMLVPIVLNIFSLISILSFGLYAVHWMILIPGRISANIKYINVLFYLKHLEQRLSTFDKNLLKLNVSKDIKLAKKLYIEIIELNLLICRWCGVDLVLVVFLSIFVVIINSYWTFLVASGLDSNSSITGDRYFQYFFQLQSIFEYITECLEVIFPYIWVNFLLAESCLKCRKLVSF